MCEQCKEESDDDYDGNSIEEKRRKAVASIVDRHPELELDPDEITFRFAPKHKWRCVRVNLNSDSPRYEIHVRGAMGPAMSGSPPLSAIAQAAFIETNMSYEEACEILDITPHTRHKAVFLSEEPPVDPLRAQSRTDSDPYEFDANITEIHETEE
jgi:hypothetical protein